MAVREGWNAHNDIGLTLEMTARSILYPGKPYGADNTIFSADNIESGGFVEAMVCLLRHKYGYECNEKIDAFIKKASGAFGKSVHEMKPEFAQNLLDDFNELIK
jgi:hypothetical protein